ncbi:MAG: hypothetical protein ACRC33_07335, partial [Gemmataceae bacterium]
KRLEATLTDGQKERFDDLIGKPFVGRLPVRLAAGGVRVSPPTSLLDRGVRYLKTAGMHKDAGLTPEQSRKLTAFAEGGSSGAAAGTAEKAMAAFLKPEQIARIKQILLQYFAERNEGTRAGGGDTTVAPGRFVEVRAELKLTDEQMKKVAAALKFEDALDEAQKVKWKALLGKPYEGGRLTLGGGFAAGPTPTLLGKVRFFDEAKELPLSDAQKKAAEEIEKAYRAESAPGRWRGAGSRRCSSSARPRASGPRRRLTSCSPSRSGSGCGSSLSRRRGRAGWSRCSARPGWPMGSG